ncbi:MAG TPA: hypothetical protein VM487_09750 [Phycisphaerae bacterium]|nr:hypothetical protein [Phycisphaerae bacterium]
MYTSVEEAERVFKYWKMIPSVPPPPPPEGEPIGDEMFWGRPGDGASIRFRRGNVVFHFRQRGCPTSQAVERARQIDRWIRDDRQIAPLGTFDPAPEIVSAGVPATLTASSTPGRTADGRPTGYERSYVTITPQFRGLGDLDKLRFVVLGSQDNGRTWSRLTQTTPAGESREKVYKIDTTERGGIPKLNEVQEDGRFLMEVPRKTGALKLKLIAATEDNLIVTKEVQVTVVPAD